MKLLQLRNSTQHLQTFIIENSLLTPPQPIVMEIPQVIVIIWKPVAGKIHQTEWLEVTVVEIVLAVVHPGKILSDRRVTDSDIPEQSAVGIPDEVEEPTEHNPAQGAREAEAVLGVEACGFATESFAQSETLRDGQM